MQDLRREIFQKKAGSDKAGSEKRIDASQIRKTGRIGMPGLRREIDRLARKVEVPQLRLYEKKVIYKSRECRLFFIHMLQTKKLDLCPIINRRIL